MSRMERVVLTDVDSGTWVAETALGPERFDLGTAMPWSVRKRTLGGGLCAGVDIVEVDNGAFSFTVVPTRGMGIWRGEYRGCTLGWDAPVKGPVHPAYVNTLDQGGLGWLRGFDEWIVRCGLEWNGAPGPDVAVDNNGNPAEVDLTLHGRIANLPANQVEIQLSAGDTPEIAVIGTVDEAMLFGSQLQLSTRIATVPGSNALTICDEVINMRAVEAELELLYHCNFGPPFLGAGAVLVAPSREVAPRDARAVEGISTYATYGAPEPGYVEQVYWHELAAAPGGATLTMLRNAAGDKGAVLRFNQKQLPCFTQWKNTGAASDGYVTGLEPGTNFPNAKAFEREQGRVLKLGPGESHCVDLRVEILTDAEAVQAVEAEVRRLEGGMHTTVHARPLARLSGGV